MTTTQTVTAHIKQSIQYGFYNGWVLTISNIIKAAKEIELTIYSEEANQVLESLKQDSKD